MEKRGERRQSNQGILYRHCDCGHELRHHDHQGCLYTVYRAKASDNIRCTCGRSRESFMHDKRRAADREGGEQRAGSAADRKQ